MERFRRRAARLDSCDELERVLGEHAHRTERALRPSIPAPHPCVEQRLSPAASGKPEPGRALIRERRRRVLERIACIKPVSASPKASMGFWMTSGAPPATVKDFWAGRCAC